MTRAALGNVIRLSQPENYVRWLPPSLLLQMPQGRRRDGWVAARVLLAMLIDDGTLSPIKCRPDGKPEFVDTGLPRFSFSHSGHAVVVMLSDESDVGCDIEYIRPRTRYMDIAQAYFSREECLWLHAQHDNVKLMQFWRLWTAREAVLKQRGESVWRMASVTLAPEQLITPDVNLHYSHIDDVAIACCAKQVFAGTWQIDTSAYR